MLLCALALFTLSCSSDDGVSDDNITQEDSQSGDDSGSTSTGLYAVSFTAEIELIEQDGTRVANDLFETGDVIAANNGERTTSYSYSSDKFSSDDPFMVDRATNYAYTAIYPADTAAFSGSNYTFKLATDQSSEEGLTSSDLLVGRVSETNSVAPVITFTHAMSSVIINVKSDSFSSGDSGELTITALAEAVCDFESDSYSGSTSKEITAYSLGDDTFVAIIAPQDVTSLTASFIDAAGGVSGAETGFNSISAFESGVQYEFDWDVEANTVTLTGVNIAEWNYVGSQSIDYDSDALPAPTLSAIGGDKRAQIEYSIVTNDSRISEVVLTIDGVEESYNADLFTFDESDFKYKYIIEDGSKLTSVGTYELSVMLKSDDGESSRNSNSVALQVYDLSAYQSSFRTPYYSYLDSSGATLLWTPVSEDDSYATFQVIYNTSTTVTVSASDTQTTLSGATAGGSYIIATKYIGIEGLPSEMLDPCEVYDTLSFSSINVGTALAKDGTVFNNIFDNDARLVGDYSTYSDSNIGQSKTAFGSIKHAWDSEVTYTNSNNMCDGYHAHGDDQAETYPNKYLGVDGCVTFDLQANYYIGQYAYWQRRSTNLYAAGNIKEFTIYGAADFGETLTNENSDYNKVTEEGVADFDSMSDKWIKIINSAELTRQGTTTGVNLATSTNADDMQDYQDIINGHHFASDNSSTAVRYIRIQIHSTWDGSAEPSPQIGEFDFWGTLVEQ